MWNSSNPALASDDIFNQVYGKGMLAGATRTNIATVQGVVNKTAILAVIAVAAGAVGYWLFTKNPMALWVGNLVGLVVVFGVYFGIRSNPARAVFLAPVYAVVEGVFLGGFTALAEWLLAQKGVQVPGGVALQAFIITGACLGSMLALYSMRILKPTRTLANVVSTATLAIGITYLLSFVLSLFGVHLPFITAFSAVNATGTAALIGLGINLFILAIASLGLILDFGMIEQRLAAEQPKHMEWYCGFALLVTLAWIYFESVKIVIRVASLLNRR